MGAYAPFGLRQHKGSSLATILDGSQVHGSFLGPPCNVDNNLLQF